MKCWRHQCDWRWVLISHAVEILQAFLWHLKGILNWENELQWSTCTNLHKDFILWRFTTLPSCQTHDVWQGTFIYLVLLKNLLRTFLLINCTTIKKKRKTSWHILVYGPRLDEMGHWNREMCLHSISFCRKHCLNICDKVTRRVFEHDILKTSHSLCFLCG